MKSSICRDEFDEFVEKAKRSDLNELILPILWVPVDPETDDEKRIYETAKSRQWIDWTDARKLDEGSPQYKALIDGMGERLAKAARSVAQKPEVAEPESSADEAGPEHGGTPTAGGGDGGTASAEVGTGVEEPPGLVDLAADAMAQAESFAGHLTRGFLKLREMTTNVIQDSPLHPSASAGQRLFYYKRIAKEMTPYVDHFEHAVKEAENDARQLNDTMFQFTELLHDPELRNAVDIENVGRVKEIPKALAEKFGDYNSYRVKLSAVGRMSRDLRVPFSAIERGFDSMDEIMELVSDWTTAMESLGDLPPSNRSPSSPDP